MTYLAAVFASDLIDWMRMSSADDVFVSKMLLETSCFVFKKANKDINYRGNKQIRGTSMTLAGQGTQLRKNVWITRFKLSQMRGNALLERFYNILDKSRGSYL